MYKALPKNQCDRLIPVYQLPGCQSFQVGGCFSEHTEYIGDINHMDTIKTAKPPLYRAARLVYDAIELAYQYARDDAPTPTAEELQQVEMLLHSLLEGYGTVGYLYHVMAQRGEKG